MQHIIISKDIEKELDKTLDSIAYDRLFILTDETTRELCLQATAQSKHLKQAKLITIPATDENKTLESTVHVWKELGEGKCTRHSCMVNIGGGMVTDLGGFAASTFKRGITFVNIPTTLLAMVDASVGGKTGINFNGLKNEIGVFNDAHSVIIDSVYLQTLDMQNIRSGYAEMLKHSLITDNEMWASHMIYDLGSKDFATLLPMIEQSIRVKERIVTEDPHENGIRKALNLGHTFGHAFESLSIRKGKPILHGYAVAYGLICELYLSSILSGFPTMKMRQTTRFITENYGKMEITCEEYDTLFALMTHDKKNIGNEINFTLLEDVGKIKINQTADKEKIFESFDFFREG